MIISALPTNCEYIDLSQHSPHSPISEECEVLGNVSKNRPKDEPAWRSELEGETGLRAAPQLSFASGPAPGRWSWCSVSKSCLSLPPSGQELNPSVLLWQADALPLGYLLARWDGWNSCCGLGGCRVAWKTGLLTHHYNLGCMFPREDADRVQRLLRGRG